MGTAWPCILTLSPLLMVTTSRAEEETVRIGCRNAVDCSDVEIKWYCCDVPWYDCCVCRFAISTRPSTDRSISRRTAITSSSVIEFETVCEVFDRDSNDLDDCQGSCCTWYVVVV